MIDSDVVPDSLRRRGTALAVGVATSVVTLAALVLAVVNVGTPDPDFTVHRQFFATDVLIALIYAPFGVFVLVRSGHVIGLGAAAGRAGVQPDLARDPVRRPGGRARRPARRTPGSSSSSSPAGSSAC